MRLHVVRHLPTAWNVEDRLQGRRDIPILEPSPEALAALAPAIQALQAAGPFDRVYCSTMQRTRQTAALFGFPDPTPEPLLDELNFGEFEGRLRSEMLAAVGDAWRDAPHTLTFGEPVTALADRIQAFLAKNAPHAKVLAFGHGGWTRALTSLQKHRTLAGMNQLHIPNGDALVFENPGA